MDRSPATRAAGYEALAEALQVSFRVLRWVMGLLLLAYLGSGVFIVGQHEKAFVLLFGQIAGRGADRVKEPGLHWTLPKPFAEIVRVPVARVQTVETRSFWHGQAAHPGQPPPRVGYTLTGDVNLLHSRWAVRYTVNDPEAYAFRFPFGAPGADRMESLIQQELDRAVTRTSLRFPIDQALRTEIEAWRGAVAAELQRRAAVLGLGIKLEGVDVLALSPPRQVIDAFTAVIAAENERSERISAARGAAARAVNEARGQAARAVAEGQAYRQRVVSEVGADADYFTKVLGEYQQNPAVIARTLRQDTVRRVLQQVEKHLVAPGATGQFELRLQISRERKQIGEKDK